MAKSLAALRNLAQRALLDGNYKKALELFEEILQQKPDDLRILMRMAELHEKLGQIQQAVGYYREAANKYAEQGFVVQAIAVYKIICRLDPTQTDVKERLQRLAKERGEDWATPSHTQKGKIHLERTPLLSGLSGSELDDFIDSLELLEVDEKEYIYREGDAGTHLYLIGMGRVLLEAKDRLGQWRVYARLGEGDFFGEHAFMACVPHKDAALAETPCTLLKIDRKTFDAWVAKYPHMRDNVEAFYRQRVLARILAITPVFGGIPEDARAALAARFQLKTYEDGDVIVREGEAGDTFYLVRSGRVKVMASNLGGKPGPVVLGELAEGDFFGEIALLRRKPRTATVVAEGSVELMALDRTAFQELVRDYPSVLQVVEAYLKKRVEDTISILLGKKQRF